MPRTQLLATEGEQGPSSAPEDSDLTLSLSGEDGAQRRVRDR